MVSVDEALELVLDAVASLAVERLPIVQAGGRIIAETIASSRDIPAFANSAMDGYAVRAADIAAASEHSPVRLRVLETVGAGQMPSQILGPGDTVRTMTGAPLAGGADAIVPVERTRSAGDDVEVLARAEPGAFVRPRGEDLKAGELVISSGTILSPADIGMLASLNRSMIDVYRHPRVAIVATGDELVDIDQIPSGAQIINSSAYALAAAILETGGEPTILKVARDHPEEVRARFSEALAFDVVLSTGGVSVGQFDHVKQVMDELGLHQRFHGVAQKPGRPLKFGTIAGKPLFGLPGNPVSTMVCFYLYVRPALRKMGGRSDLGLPRLSVRCATDLKVASGLTEFIRVKLERRSGDWCAVSTGNQSSGVLSSLSRADALLIGPANVDVLRAGDQATVLVLDSAAATDAAAYFEARRRHAN